MGLNSKEAKRLEIILLVINKELTQKEAALKLEITERQFRRILKKFRDDGEKSLIHKNTGQPSPSYSRGLSLLDYQKRK